MGAPLPQRSVADSEGSSSPCSCAQVDAGWLDAATFEPVIKLAWQGLSTGPASKLLLHGMFCFENYFPDPEETKSSV